MASPLFVEGSRILTPDEVTAIRSVIYKRAPRAMFDLLLYTGIRLYEVRQLADNPAIFDEERKQLSITGTIRKPESTAQVREVRVGDRGCASVRTFLDLGAKVPGNEATWHMNLSRWSKAAGLVPLATATTGSNPAGITTRTCRRTWESWLNAAFPAEVARIALSQGRFRTAAIRRYGSIPWTDDEMEAIRREVEGWCPRDRHPDQRIRR